MTTQQLFRKYILLSEERKAKDEEYHQLTDELNDLITAVASTETNRNLQNLDEINKKRARAKTQVLELTQLTDQLDDLKKEALALLEDLADISFTINVETKHTEKSYLIKSSGGDEVIYYVIQ